MRVALVRREVQSFVLRGNVVDFVMAVVIGGALSRIITAVVNGVVMPLIGLWRPDLQWDKWSLGPFQVGQIISAAVDLAAKTFVVYLVVVKGAKVLLGRPGTELLEPPTRICPSCREPVHAEAVRCKHCTSRLPLLVPQEGSPMPEAGPLARR